MKLTGIASICILVLAIGCSKSSTPDKKVVASPTSASKPATTQAASAPSPWVPLGDRNWPPRNPMDNMTPEQKIAYAREHFGPELVLIRKHPWKRPTGPDVVTAVDKVFGTGFTTAPNGMLKPMPGVDFLHLTAKQVRSLIGNPSSKARDDGAICWDYSYEGTNRFFRLSFKNGKVAGYRGGNL